MQRTSAEDSVAGVKFFWSPLKIGRNVAINSPCSRRFSVDLTGRHFLHVMDKITMSKTEGSVVYTNRNQRSSEASNRNDFTLDWRLV